MKTFLPKVDEIERKWRVVDADGQILGRLAVRIADALRGKDKPTFTPHLDCGDYIIVVNAKKVSMTGRKNEEKMYEDYTGHMSGRKLQTAKEIRKHKPCRMIQDAVWGMMPKGRLGRAQFEKLKVYAGAEHPHAAQTPEEF
jgi:large subunit ribosomal protein L13